MMVRRAEDRDLDEIVRVWKSNIYSAVTPETIEFWFRRNKKYFFVCELDGRIVGFVAGTVKSPERIHISGIAVDAEHRRKQIGSALLSTIERESYKEGFRKVTLEVRKSNEAAIKFYEKNGYRRTGVTPFYYFDGEDALNYEKSLNP